MATIDDTIANMFQDEIETPLAIVMDFHYVLFGIGPAMTFLSVIAFVMHRRRAKKQVAALYGVNNNNNNNNILYSSQREIKAVVRSHNEEHTAIILSH